MFGTTLDFKIDTGADISIISRSVSEALPQKPPIQNSSVSWRKLNILGNCTAKIRHKDEYYKFRMVILESDKAASLLGRDVATRMGLVTRIGEVSKESKPKIGFLKTQPVAIKWKDDANPLCVTLARKVPIPLMNKVQEVSTSKIVSLDRRSSPTLVTESVLKM